MLKKNQILGVIGVALILAIIVLGAVAVSVSDSLDVEGLEDPRAFPAIMDLQDVYDWALPVLGLSTLLVAVGVVISHARMQMKMILALGLLLFFGGFLVTIVRFDSSMDLALKIEPAFAALQVEAASAQEQAQAAVDAGQELPPPSPLLALQADAMSREIDALDEALNSITILSVLWAAAYTVLCGAALVVVYRTDTADTE